MLSEHFPHGHRCQKTATKTFGSRYFSGHVHVHNSETQELCGRVSANESLEGRKIPSKNSAENVPWKLWNAVKVNQQRSNGIQLKDFTGQKEEQRSEHCSRVMRPP